MPTDHAEYVDQRVIYHIECSNAVGSTAIPCASPDVAAWLKLKLSVALACADGHTAQPYRCFFFLLLS